MAVARQSQLGSVFMRLSSPAFSDGGPIPRRYSAPGENELPPFRIHDVSENAQSLVLVLKDVDSPLGEVTHWHAWNIPPQTASLDAVHLPAECCVGIDSFGKVGYLGPAPPEGRHHYRMILLALDTWLDLPTGSTRGALDRAVKGHVIDRAEMMGFMEAPASDGDTT